MNDNLIFHIGLHKTGTTYLQSYLFKKLDVSLIRGWQSHRDLFKMSLNRRILISDEGISGDFMSDDYSKMFYENLNKINTWYKNPLIIFGIREQSEFIISLYKQYLNQGGVGDFTEFFDIKNNEGLIKHNDILMMEKINYLKANFNNVFIYSQEALKNRENDFLEALRNIYKISSNDSIPNLKKISRNVGMKTAFQIKTMIRLNKLDYMLKKNHPTLTIRGNVFKKFKIHPRNLVHGLVGNMSKKKFRIGNEEKIYIENFYKSDWKAAVQEISF